LRGVYNSTSDPLSTKTPLKVYGRLAWVVWKTYSGVTSHEERRPLNCLEKKLKKKVPIFGSGSNLGGQHGDESGGGEKYRLGARELAGPADPR